MLHLDPNQRPSIKDILEHPWMNEETPSEEQVVNEFAERKKAVDESVKSEKEDKRSEQASRNAQRVMRSGGASKEEAK